MEAVIGELIENDYPGASVKRIAARAGVAKTTITGAGEVSTGFWPR
jgi:AcrR family transcriptional regulator